MGLITAIMSDAKKTLLEGELIVVITELVKTSVFVGNKKFSYPFLCNCCNRVYNS